MNTPILDDPGHDRAEPEMVAIDVIDVAVLADTCRYIVDWLSGAPTAVAASLSDFGGPLAHLMLADTLDRLADALVRAVPSRTAQGVTTPTPLSPGETLGLAGFLADLAVHGWPADPDPAGWIADDCRRWARRLLRTPGMVA
jgi:hypothetical protein